MLVAVHQSVINFITYEYASHVDVFNSGEMIIIKEWNLYHREAFQIITDETENESVAFK